MLNRRYTGLIALALATTTVAAVIVVVVAVSGGRSTARHGHPISMLEEPVDMFSHPARTLQTFRSLGAKVMRIPLIWNLVAPAPSSYHPPARFEAANPAAYPAGNWRGFDAIVEDASRNGVEPDLVLTGDAPVWATGSAPTRAERSSGRWNPSATAYGQFVRAVARRYSGEYRPPGAGKPLPRVHFWEIWNEQNRSNRTPTRCRGDARQVPAPAMPA